MLRPLSPHACLGVSLLRLGMYSFLFFKCFSCPSCASVSLLACCSFRFVFWRPLLRTRFPRNILILTFVSVLLPCPRPGAPFVGMALRLYLGVCFSLCSPRLVLLHSFTYFYSFCIRFLCFLAHFRPPGIIFHVFWSVLGSFPAPGRFFSLPGRPFWSLPKRVPKKGALAHPRTDSPYPCWSILASILVPFLVAFSGLKIGLFLDPPGRDFGPKRDPFWTPFWC